MKSRYAKTAALTLSLGLLGGGFWLQAAHFRGQAEDARRQRRRRRQQAFVTQLKNDRLFSASGASYTHGRLSRVARYGEYARSEDIDLWACYREHRDDPAARINLAFILILDRSEAYFRYARSHVEQVPATEVLLWVALAEMPPAPHLPAELKARLGSLAARSKKPAGLWYSARRYRQAGLEQRAVELSLRLLERPSHEGIAAARSLVADGPHRLRAIDYLWLVAESGRKEPARSALLALVDVYDAARTHAYRAYTALDTAENARRLREELKKRRREPASRPAGGDRP